MRNLEERETQILAHLLIELDELGLPADQELLSIVNNGVGDVMTPITASKNVIGPNIERQIAFLNKADYRDIFRTLKDESPELQAYFLQINRWVWKEELLSCFDAGTVLRINEATDAFKELYLLKENARAKKLQQTLIAEIVRQISLSYATAPSINLNRKKGMFAYLLRKLGLGESRAFIK